MWNCSGLFAGRGKPEIPVENGMQVKGMECCWTPSRFSRAKGEDLDYLTYCRQVYLNILCKAAKQVNCSGSRAELMLTCVPKSAERS